MNKRFLFPFLLIFALLLAACSQAVPEPSAQEESAAVEEPAAEEAAAEVAEEEAAPEEAMEEKRVLRIAHAWPLRIDPGIGSDFVALTVHPNLYDTLVFPTTDGDLIPWVAESWEVSDDNLTYTFHLRKGVKFHDGSELQASDVVFSMNRLLTVGQGVAYMYVDRVESAEALDDYTVQFKIKEPYALFEQTMLRLFILNEEQVTAQIKDEGEYGDFGDYATDWLLTHDAGSGPYKVKEFQLEEFIVLEKNEDWWAADQFVDNAPDEVRVIPLPEAAILKTLMANQELEISDQWQSSDTFKSVDELDGVDIAAFDAVTVLHLYLNTSQPPLDDVHVRRAIAYAFDYETATNIDWPGTPQSRAPVPMGVAGANPNLNYYQTDLDKAREELAQSAYADTIGDYTIAFHWVTEVPDEEKYALLMQSNLAEIGINVEITGTPWLTITELVTHPETTPGILPVYLNADLPEAGALLQQRYHSNTTGTFYQGEWLLNDEIDAKIDQALSTLDRDERLKLYGELQEQIMEMSPTIYAFDQLQKHAYQTYIDWPVVNGTVYPVMGYNQFFPFIGVNPHS